MNQSLSDMINKVIEDYEVLLLRYVCGIIKDPEQAKDIVQEALIRYLREMQNSKEISNTRAWLYRVCHNLALDYIRKFKRRSASLENFQPTLADNNLKSPDEELSLKDETGLVNESLKELDERERRIIHMKVRDNMSYKEIAGAMDISVSNVGFILHKTMKKLATIYKTKNEVAP